MRDDEENTWAAMRDRIFRAPAGVVLLALCLGITGCAKSTPLPDLVKDPQTVLTKDERKRAIVDLEQGKEKAVSAAEKQIEKSH